MFNEFILQLIYLRPAIEQELPGVQIYINHKDKFKIDSYRTSPASSFKKYDYAYVRDLKFDNVSHPVERLLTESDIKLNYLKPPRPKSVNTRCVLLTKGLGSVASMSRAEIDETQKMAEKKGFYVEINENIDNAGWVIGVECENFYRAAIDGTKVTLAPTGFGTKFFQKIFPNGEVLHR